MTPSGDDQGAGKDNPVQKIPDFLSSLVLSHHVLKSISVFGEKGRIAGGPRIASDAGDAPDSGTVEEEDLRGKNEVVLRKEGEGPGRIENGMDDPEIPRKTEAFQGAQAIQNGPLGTDPDRSRRRLPPENLEISGGLPLREENEEETDSRSGAGLKTVHDMPDMERPVAEDIGAQEASSEESESL